MAEDRSQASRRHRRRRDHRAGPTADALWDGVVGGNVAIRDVEAPVDGRLPDRASAARSRSDVAPEREYRHPDDYREPVIDFALKASEEAVGAAAASAIGQIPPERWGVVIGTCNAGLLAGEEWYRRRLKGEEAPIRELLLLVAAAGGRRGARRAPSASRARCCP